MTEFDLNGGPAANDWPDEDEIECAICGHYVERPAAEIDDHCDWCRKRYHMDCSKCGEYIEECTCPAE